MNTILQTPRARLREFTEDDLDVLVPLVADPEQMRFYPSTRTRDDARAWIQLNLRRYVEPGYGFWLVEAIDSGEFIGYSGIRPQTVDGIDETELGWHIAKTHWNQGLGTEVAGAVRDLAFSRFELDRLIALIDPANVASVRVAEKIGMRVEKEAVVDGYPWTIYSVRSPRK